MLRSCLCGRMCRIDGRMQIVARYRNGAAQMGFVVRGQRCDGCGTRYRQSGARAYHVAAQPEPVKQWSDHTVERLAPGWYRAYSFGVYAGDFESMQEAYDADPYELVDPLLIGWDGSKTTPLRRAA